MQLIRVNPFMIIPILEPLARREAEDEVMSLDCEDEAQIREVIQRLIVPHFQTFDANSRSKIKHTLRYYLTGNVPDQVRRKVLVDAVDSLLIPLNLPENPFRFYEWIWEELFHEPMSDPGPDCRIVINEDFEEPNSIRTDT